MTKFGRKAVLMIASLVSLFALPALADSNTQEKAQASQNILQREIARETAPVKSLADFYSITQVKSSYSNVLAKLSNRGRAELTASLTFNEKGLTGFNYRAIEDELTVTDAYTLLSMFGHQHLVGKLNGLKIHTKEDVLIRQHLTAQESGLRPIGNGDYMDFYCSGRATCAASANYICTRNC